MAGFFFLDEDAGVGFNNPLALVAEDVVDPEAFVGTGVFVSFFGAFLCSSDPRIAETCFWISESTLLFVRLQLLGRCSFNHRLL